MSSVYVRFAMYCCSLANVRIELLVINNLFSLLVKTEARSVSALIKLSAYLHGKFDATICDVNTYHLLGWAT